jgi:hypothetical protein
LPRRTNLPRLGRLGAAAACQDGLAKRIEDRYGWRIKDLRKLANREDLVAHHRRSLVERTVAWLNTYCRMSKEYDGLPDRRDTRMYAAARHPLPCRLGPA